MREQHEQQVALGVLGPLEVAVGGRVQRLSGPRLRALLALLVAAAGRVVSVAALVEGLWGADPPADAERTVRAYVSRLRTILRTGAGLAADELVVTRAPGYLLLVEPVAVDAARFERLAADGRRALQGGQPAVAADRLAAALALWRGEPYGEFDAAALRAEGVRLERLRLAAVQDRIEADLAVGLGGELVAELEGLTGQHPGHERLWGQLMTALYRAGRQADALAAFQRARRALVAGSGVEPTPALLEVHRQVLAQDAGLLPAAAHPATAEPELPPAGLVVPSQLPAAARFFTGREEYLARLIEPAGDPPTLVVNAVDGMAGIGKTAVAVQAAHRLTEAGGFPDGTLFVDLHGFSGRAPTDPMDALEAMLRGLGVSGPQIPADPDARVGLYRSVTARRRLLVVLDNARDEAQVRPLLPGAPTCRVLVTSRRRLAGLDDADHLTLTTLGPDEAVQLFRAVAGAGRDLGDATVVERIVAACGLLPLAVRVAAARLRASRTWTGPTLLARLEAAQDRLAELDDGDRSVAAALTVSVQQLAADQRQAFIVLGLHPGAEYEPYATAALLDTSAEAAGRLLAGLERVNLIEAPSAGRYRFHDLIRAYAATTARTHSDAGRRAALDRLYDHYATATAAAVRLAYPYLDPHRAHDQAAPAELVQPPLPTADAALAWLDTERPNLLAAARHAADHDRPGHTTDQSAALHHHLHTRGQFADAGALHRQALTAAGTTGDRRARITALNDLGDIHRRQNRFAEAVACHIEALAAARASGHRGGQVPALIGLGWIHCHLGRHREAGGCYAEALRIAKATGDRAGELAAQLGLGWTRLYPGRPGEAVDWWAEARETARAIGDRQGELHALTALGQGYQRQRRYALAMHSHTEALRTAREIGYRLGELAPLTGLGWIHEAQGRYGPAADCHTEALRTAQAIGDRYGEIVALGGLANVEYAQGQYGVAAGCYQQVLEQATEFGNGNWQFEGQLGLARTAAATGHPAQARTAYEHALTLARDLGQDADQARVHDGLAHAYRALGDPGRARRHWQQALHLLATLGVPAAYDVTATGIRAQLAAITEH